MTRKNGSARRLRAFCSAFMLTFCLLLLGAGFLIADYNTRQTETGAGSLRIDVSTQEGRVMLNLFGREKAVTVSDTVRDWAGRAWALAPAGWRAEAWLFEAEREAAPVLLEAVGAQG